MCVRVSAPHKTTWRNLHRQVRRCCIKFRRLQSSRRNATQWRLCCVGAANHINVLLLPSYSTKKYEIKQYVTITHVRVTSPTSKRSLSVMKCVALKLISIIRNFWRSRGNKMLFLSQKYLLWEVSYLKITVLNMMKNTKHLESLKIKNDLHTEYTTLSCLTWWNKMLKIAWKKIIITFSLFVWCSEIWNFMTISQMKFVHYKLFLR